jgi:peptidoglycan/LPS O-acetylase OafA/YrhL
MSAGTVAAPEEIKLGNRRIWAASSLVFALALMSWLKTGIVYTIYAQLGVEHPIGDCIYVMIRLTALAVLGRVYLGFRKVQGTSEPSKVRLTSVKTFDPLMGLRAFACALVLFGHYFIVVYPPSGSSALHGSGRNSLMALSGSPWAGVWVFFTLSGYLMGKGFARGRYSLDEPGVLLYLRNRMLRIVPIYYVAIFLLSVWIYPQIFSLKNLWMLIEILTFDYRGELPINPDGALWSVTTEVQFYFLVPAIFALLLLLRKKAPKLVYSLPAWLLISGIVWRLVLLQTGSDTYLYSYSPLIPNLDLFVVGLSLNFLPTPKQFLSGKRGLGAAILIGVTCAFYLLASFSSFKGVRIHQGGIVKIWTFGPAISCAFASVFIYIAETRGRFTLPNGISGRVLRAIQGVGTLTYCIYVFHAEIYVSLRRIVPESLSVWRAIIFFPAVLSAVLAVAWIFNRFIEEPFEQRKTVSAGR